MNFFKTRRKALAEPHDAREGVDDAELARPRRLGDQQAAIVGAEVERGIERGIVAVGGPVRS